MFLHTLIAEQATPSFVAITLPRLVASAPHTARVTNALVTRLALPTEATTRREKKQRQNKSKENKHCPTLQ